MKLNLQGDIERLMQLNEKINAVASIILTDVGNEISNNAKQNAPYLTGALRRSIAPDFNSIKKGFSVVGSPLKYASKREFINNKNPQTRYYLERAFTEHVDDIVDIIMEDLDLKLKEK